MVAEDRLWVSAVMDETVVEDLVPLVAVINISITVVVVVDFKIVSMRIAHIFSMY